MTGIKPYIKPTVRYPFGVYWGFGGGMYRYHIARGSASNRTTRGYHGLAGVEFFSEDRRRVVRIEFEMNAVGGPGHDQVWAVAMFGGAASVGISRRF